MPDKFCITVRFGEPLRHAVGKYRIEVTLTNPATLADLLTYLEQAFTDFSASYRGTELGQSYPYRWFVNRKQITDQSFADHALNDGDLIHIVIPVAGGGPSHRRPPVLTTQ